eukprot:CAMPEP_0201587300 /NCGR_PEP_ID=MMETSP0190_2-20130828/142512_1 /ASSEMBLY_ACC=CAM_ASM_000263 /TAXON_ID=37353 /ORGANISM="Rosalina sp." /LENGTH=81 /DNA_ID=CAMNT_0048037061 /DNA_START=53 /DNA_END=295 /DNA_ORIENTATION=+
MNLVVTPTRCLDPKPCYSESTTESGSRSGSPLGAAVSLSPGNDVIYAQDNKPTHAPVLQHPPLPQYVSSSANTITANPHHV